VRDPDTPGWATTTDAGRCGRPHAEPDHT
jgi:hypothetical protein